MKYIMTIVFAIALFGCPELKSPTNSDGGEPPFPDMVSPIYERHN